MAALRFAPRSRPRLSRLALLRPFLLPGPSTVLALDLRLTSLRAHRAPPSQWSVCPRDQLVASRTLAFRLRADCRPTTELLGKQRQCRRDRVDMMAVDVGFTP